MIYTLITGASSGIGEEFARQCAAKKQNLILVARSEDLLRSLAKELLKKHDIDIQIVVLDLSLSNSAEKLFKACENKKLEVNFLINNAGVGTIGRFEDFPADRIEEMINLNMLTLTKLSYFFLPTLKEYKGILLNVASNVAFAPCPYLTVYSATKAYVLHFSEALQVEHKEVRILALCPGPTHTDFYRKAQASPKDIKFKFREPKEVVEEAMSALNKNKPLTVVGWENKIMTFLMRLVSKKQGSVFSSGLIKESKKRKAA